MLIVTVGVCDGLGKQRILISDFGVHLAQIYQAAKTKPSRRATKKRWFLALGVSAQSRP